MLQLSSVDHDSIPPQLTFAETYNAAHDLLERNLIAGRRDKPAFIDDERSLTYGQLEEGSAAFAHGLIALGMQREQRVLLCMHDTVDLPVAFLGAIRAGIVPVLANTLLTQNDYAFLLNDCRAPVAVVSGALSPLFESIRQRTPQLRNLVISGSHAGPGTLTEMLESNRRPFDTVETHRDEPCFWLYSSGSTGNPKGTVHSQASLMQTAELFGRGILGISESDVCFSAAKIFFAYGLGNSLSFPLSQGATTILMAERATPAAIFQRLQKHRPTVFCGVPTLYAGLLSSPELPPGPSTHLRTCTSAGEPLPAAIGERWLAHFGVDIIDGIGSTEMLHIYLSNKPGDVAYGTTGRPVPGYEIRLVDDQERPVPPGDAGELHVRGPSGALLYWNNRDRTRHTFLGDWTRSGDKFVQREDGRYVYCGRSDDMLKVSGIYVSPAEVEAALASHPAVLEAAVVGRKDADELIKPMAFIVLKDPSQAGDALAAELKGHVKSLLAPYKYPRWFEFRSDLPKTATGKIQRFRLRADLEHGK
ncbi:MAG: benzoate-CoA ligase [Pseudomonadota bacterium]|jgi:benzoate-CoA ligase